MRLADHEVDVPCPRCHRTFKTRLGNTSSGTQTHCPHCGVLFKGEGDGVGTAQRAIDDFAAQLKKLGHR